MNKLNKIRQILVAYGVRVYDLEWLLKDLMKVVKETPYVGKVNNDNPTYMERILNDL